MIIYNSVKNEYKFEDIIRSKAVIVVVEKMSSSALDTTITRWLEVFAVFKIFNVFAT